MTIKQILAAVALVCAVLAIVGVSGPLMPVAIILLAVVGLL